MAFWNNYTSKYDVFLQILMRFTKYFYPIEKVEINQNEVVENLASIG